MITLRSVLPAEIRETSGNLDVSISGISYDSRQCRPGELFVALPGANQNGEAFVSDAVNLGAAAVMTEGPIKDWGVPVVQVPNARRALSHLAKVYYQHPSSRVALIGITGTKGKTTTTYLLQSILGQKFGKAFRFGTVEYDLGFVVKPAKNTTPESLELTRMIQESLQQGVRAGVIEVSSHALKTFRVEDLAFAAAGFANLTMEHTEFHPTMEDYFQAKRRLFLDLLPSDHMAVVGIDDDWGKRLAGELKTAGRPVWTVSVKEASADFCVGALEMNGLGSRFEILAEGSPHVCLVHLPGPFNVFNALMAAGLARSVGVSWEEIQNGLNGLRQVPGRFESIPNTRGFTVIVDYAHSPASLENVLLAVRPLARGRVISVFGCGGNRSPDKRPIMGRLSATLADVTVVTSDNPRKEKPEEIISQIMTGIAVLPPDQRHEVHTEVDRHKAIEMAVGMARAGDVILIAGKGHETGQTFADRTLPFDDREVVREILLGQKEGVAHA